MTAVRRTAAMLPELLPRNSSIYKAFSVLPRYVKDHTQVRNKCLVRSSSSFTMRFTIAVLISTYFLFLLALPEAPSEKLFILRECYFSNSPAKNGAEEWLYDLIWDRVVYVSEHLLYPTRCHIVTSGQHEPSWSNSLIYGNRELSLLMLNI